MMGMTTSATLITGLVEILPTGRIRGSLYQSRPRQKRWDRSRRLPVGALRDDAGRLPLWTLFGLLCLLAPLGPWPRLVVQAASGEAGRPIAVHELLAAPDHYDGARVSVVGLVRSIELQRGRLGSQYVEITLEGVPSAGGQTTPAVTVITPVLKRYRVGARLAVEGIYHRTGYQGGRPYEYFIDAESIRPDQAV